MKQKRMRMRDWKNKLILDRQKVVVDLQTGNCLVLSFQSVLYIRGFGVLGFWGFGVILESKHS